MTRHPDSIEALELVLTHYQGRLKDHHDKATRDHYETMYLQEYHELHRIDKDKAKPYMDWWVRYAKW